MTGPQAERKRNVNAEHKRKTQNARHPPCVFSCPSRCSSIALHLMLASSSGVSKCFLGFQGSRKDFAQQKLCGIISGLPQKSHGEFCGKRSGRRIRSCGKRSAPQTKPPCRDEVGSLPHANLETAYYPCRFRAPAQMRSRCVGRGDASRAVKPRGTQRRTCWLCGDESAVSTARDGVRRGTSLTEGLLSPHFGLLFGGAQALP